MFVSVSKSTMIDYTPLSHGDTKGKLCRMSGSPTCEFCTKHTNKLVQFLCQFVQVPWRFLFMIHSNYKPIIKSLQWSQEPIYVRIVHVSTIPIVERPDHPKIDCAQRFSKSSSDVTADKRNILVHGDARSQEIQKAQFHCYTSNRA